MSEYLVEWVKRPDGTTEFRTRPPCKALTDDVIKKFYKRAQGIVIVMHGSEVAHHKMILRHIIMVSIQAWLDGRSMVFDEMMKGQER